MGFLTPSCRTGRIALPVLFLALAALGCGDDEAYRRVDFSKTYPSPRASGPEPAAGTLRVAVGAMISPQETIRYYKDLVDYLGKRLGSRAVVIQRRTYQEINELLSTNRADLAFICTGPYALGREKYGFQALAVPVVRSEPFYRSYLIVGRRSPYQNLSDLKGKSFALTDPDSLTGDLAPRYWLARDGLSAEAFFGRVIHSYSHDNSIYAVAKGLVDAAAVDGHKWEYFEKNDPRYTHETRVIRKSEPFGSPPVVASASLSPETRERVRNELLLMHEDPEGRAILQKLMVDRFVPAQEKWYEPVRLMARVVQDAGREGADGPEEP